MFAYGAFVLSKIKLIDSRGGSRITKITVKTLGVLASFLVSISLVACAPTNENSHQEPTPESTRSAYDQEDYSLGSRYGAKLKNSSQMYSNAVQLKKICFTEYSNLPTDLQNHDDGSRVSEKEFIDGCFVNGVR